jgi:hypothetical protein
MGGGRPRTRLPPRTGTHYALMQDINPKVVCESSAFKDQASLPAAAVPAGPVPAPAVQFQLELKFDDNADTSSESDTDEEDSVWTPAGKLKKRMPVDFDGLSFKQVKPSAPSTPVKAHPPHPALPPGDVCLLCRTRNASVGRAV